MNNLIYICIALSICSSTHSMEQSFVAEYGGPYLPPTHVSFCKIGAAYKGAPAIISLLANGADQITLENLIQEIKLGNLRIVETDYCPEDMNEILIIFQAIKINAEEVQQIRSGAKSLVYLSKTNKNIIKDIRGLMSPYFIQGVIDQKMDLIRNNVSQESWATFDKAQLVKVIKNNIEKELKGNSNQQ